MADIEMIDDAYWLKFAKDHVTSAITARDEAATKIDNFLGIIWPIYTAIFTGAILFHQITDNGVIVVVMALPVVIIPLARFLCLRVLLPPLVRFYPNVPDDIEQNGYAQIVLKKSARLKSAQFGSFIAALSIGAAIFFFRISDGTKKNYYVEATYNGSSKNIQIEGRALADKEIALSIAGTTDSAKKIWSYKNLSVVKSDGQGLFHLIVVNTEIIDSIRTFANWTDNNVTQTIKNTTK